MAPRKRSRNPDGTFSSSGGSQTGGTGDVKPQWLTVQTTSPTGANDYSVNQFTIPQIVLGGVGTATIIEILRVDWYLGIADFADANSLHMAYLTTNSRRSQNETLNLATLTQDVQDSTTFAMVIREKTTFGTSGGHVAVQPYTVDMTDSNGNGILVAGSQLTMVSGNFSDTLTSSATGKILYRYVNVGITEYVGIVASQFST